MNKRPSLIRATIAICIIAIATIMLWVNVCFGFDLYKYIGKDVIIITRSEMVYSGKITTVVALDICKQYDQWGNCLIKDTEHIIFFTQWNGEQRTFNSRNVLNILERVKNAG